MKEERTETVVIATRNRGKMGEMEAILAPLSLRLLSLEGFPQIGQVPEGGTTFAENARQKASFVSRFTGLVTIADDSGLEVEALNGRPGVFSARYAGEKATDEDRVKKLLAEMSGVPQAKRQARFVCALAIAAPDGKTEMVEGECRGLIARAPRGKHGFGYDPVFFLPQLGKTMAELPPEMKNRISHRARALEGLKRIIPRFLAYYENRKSENENRKS